MVGRQCAVSLLFDICYLLFVLNFLAICCFLFVICHLLQITFVVCYIYYLLFAFISLIKNN